MPSLKVFKKAAKNSGVKLHEYVFDLHEDYEDQFYQLNTKYSREPKHAVLVTDEESLDRMGEHEVLNEQGFVREEFIAVCFWRALTIPVAGYEPLEFFMKIFKSEGGKPLPPPKVPRLDELAKDKLREQGMSNEEIHRALGVPFNRNKDSIDKMFKCAVKTQTEYFANFDMDEIPDEELIDRIENMPPPTRKRNFTLVFHAKNVHAIKEYRRQKGIDDGDEYNVLGFALIDGEVYPMSALYPEMETMDWWFQKLGPVPRKFI